MDKKELGERIKSARSLCSQKLGIRLTQQLLAEKIGISRSYMGDIESGRTYPTLVVLSSLADACGLPLSFFSIDGEDGETVPFINHSGGQALDAAANSLEKLRTSPLPTVSSSSASPDPALAASANRLIPIPVLGIIRAGAPIVADENILSYEYIPEGMAKGGVFFGLKVTGDSMNNSRIYDGDIVLVRQQDSVENGEIAVILIDGESATIKRFFRTDSMVTLMPDSSNKEHPPRFIDITRNEVRVLGKVIKVIINME